MEVQEGEEMKKDCFAYKPLKHCTALNEMICIKGECPFYKTRKQFTEDAEKAKNKNRLVVTKC